MSKLSKSVVHFGQKGTQINYFATFSKIQAKFWTDIPRVTCFALGKMQNERQKWKLLSRVRFTDLEKLNANLLIVDIGKNSLLP
jgi:hypothetical protein